MRDPPPEPGRIRGLFRRATETGDWQFRLVAWLELAGACVCHHCLEIAAGAA